MTEELHQNFVAKQHALEGALQEKIFISGLTGPLRIFQRKSGHRHSMDDTTTAWYALQKEPNAQSVLDLGAGVGTLGIIVLSALPSTAKLTCVEAQAISFALLQANIECNVLTARAIALHSDLRTLELPETFELITANPPYFPRASGTLPRDSQKAYARFELRGDLSDYAKTAKRLLTKDGTFVYCFPFAQKERGIKLVESAGLYVHSIRDVFPKEGRPPLLTLYCARHAPAHEIQQENDFIILKSQGGYSEEMIAMQKSRGFAKDGTVVGKR